MSISQLKLRGKNTIEPHKNRLYKAATLYFVLQALLIIISTAFGNDNNGNISNTIDSIGGLLIYPIFLANITLVSAIYTNKSEDISSFHYYKQGKNFIKAILTNILPAIFALLWVLPLIVIAGILAANLAFGSISPTGFGVLYAIVLVAIAVLGIYKGLQYSLTPYIVSTHSDIGVRAAIKESKTILKGKVGQLFLLNLSFIGWIILIPFTLGLISIWLIPFYNATIFEFYLSVSSNDKSSQDTETPVHSIEN